MTMTFGVTCASIKYSSLLRTCYGIPSKGPQDSSFRPKAQRLVEPSSEGAAPLRKLKAALLEAVSRANNALQPSEAFCLQAEVEELAAQLAAVNPTANPADSPLVSGSWALVYTGRSAQLAPAAFGAAPADSLRTGVQRSLQAASDTAYQFFYRAFPLIAGSAVGRRSGSSKATNIQIIDLDGGRVDNVVRFKLGSTPGEICVSGDAAAVPSEQTGGKSVRLRVTFRAFTLHIGRGPRLALPLRWLSPVGFVDTLYLDEQMRISVGDKGSLFVVTRLGSSSDPPGT